MQEREFDVKLYAKVFRNGSVEVTAVVACKNCSREEACWWVYPDVETFVCGGNQGRNGEDVISEFVERVMCDDACKVERELRRIAEKFGGEVVEVSAEWER